MSMLPADAHRRLEPLWFRYRPETPVQRTKVISDKLREIAAYIDRQPCEHIGGQLFLAVDANDVMHINANLRMKAIL